MAFGVKIIAKHFHRTWRISFFVEQSWGKRTQEIDHTDVNIYDLALVGARNTPPIISITHCNAIPAVTRLPG